MQCRNYMLRVGDLEMRLLSELVFTGHCEE